MDDERTKLEKLVEYLSESLDIDLKIRDQEEWMEKSILKRVRVVRKGESSSFEKTRPVEEIIRESGKLD